MCFNALWGGQISQKKEKRKEKRDLKVDWLICDKISGFAGFSWSNENTLNYLYFFFSPSTSYWVRFFGQSNFHFEN
jgi:hypothetical protein